MCGLRLEEENRMARLVSFSFARAVSARGNYHYREDTTVRHILAFRSRSRLNPPTLTYSFFTHIFDTLNPPRGNETDEAMHSAQTSGMVLYFIMLIL